MSSYGFRLFTVEVFNGRKQRPVNFKDCNGEHFAEVADRLLKSLSVETMVGPPRLSDLAEGNDVETEMEEESRSFDAPAFRVSDDVIVRDRTVRGSVWTGRFGSHQLALGTGDPSQDTDIQDKAASRNFRFILALPDDGVVGILAMEEIGRSCPVGSTVGWMRWQSQFEASQVKKVGNGVDYPAWRIRAQPLTDEEHLDRMIRDGKVEKLELVKHSIASDRTRQSERFRVSARITNESMVARVSQAIKEWAKPGNAETQEPNLRDLDGEAARQLAAIVGPEIVDVDFEDGWVVVQDPFEKTKKVSPSRMSEIFTYEQGRDRRFDTPEFYAVVRSTAMRLQAAHKINIEWPLE